ncbi:MAG: L-glutamate gamma-semialdehyde dehydrogenase [Desulfosarcinaceae bacterium]|nr:L-glutamate gamma-semialdehyde dehydrogenase [Desulfosarcinaceae bacterium]
MSNAIFKLDPPVNEPILSYAPGTSERAAITKRLGELRSEAIEIPLIIGGEEVRTGQFAECRVPHDHGHVLAKYHLAGEKEIAQAVTAAEKAADGWARMDWSDRLAIFNRAAAIMAGPHRATLNAATILGQSKNLFQAEIDAACEIIDFLRFNSYFATQIYQQQPISETGVWNQLEYRPLEGFVFAVSPFNFTAIAGNLTSAPAMLGNTVIWKPASTAVFSNYYLMRVFEAAGLPPGVINFLPGPGSQVGPRLLRDPGLAGVHFTGSTGVFQSIWQTVGNNIATYRGYPRLVGETGGKDFIFVHPSADTAATRTALIRGAFEYQGQKCSAASRAYLPESMWAALKSDLIASVSELPMGSPEVFSNFVNAVIDRAAFDSITTHIDVARNHPDCEILVGGGSDASEGYYIEPTVILAKKPDVPAMTEEIFGPVLTLYVYPDSDYEATLRLCDQTSPYALTGAIFARDRAAIATAKAILVNAAGNFYINDKPTGAVVGQQPFGGARASGTNDKAGSHLNLMRWLSPRTIKETFVPPQDYRYPFMG